MQECHQIHHSWSGNVGARGHAVSIQANIMGHQQVSGPDHFGRARALLLLAQTVLSHGSAKRLAEATRVFDTQAKQQDCMARRMSHPPPLGFIHWLSQSCCTRQQIKRFATVPGIP